MSVIVGKLVQAWFIITYSVLLGLIKSLQTVLRLTLEPFSKGICRKLENYLYLPAFQCFVFLVDWWSEIKLILHTDGEAKEIFFGKENAMCFINTQNNFLQQLIMAKLGDNFNMVQCCDNNMLQWSECNHFESNKYTTYRQIGRNQYWCVLFPEYDKSLLNCANCGDLSKPCPNFSTFRNNLKLSLDSKGNYDAIYDISIVVTGDRKKISARDVFNKQIIDVHVYLKRIPIDELPEEESEQKIFLEELNAEKKFSILEFLENGEFLECQTGINIIEQYEFEPSLRSAVSFTVCSAFVLLLFVGVIFLL